MKTATTEDNIGKVAGLCVKALVEFLGHLALLLYRLVTALIGKIRGFVEERGSTRNKDNQLQEKEDNHHGFTTKRRQ